MIPLVGKKTKKYKINALFYDFTITHSLASSFGVLWGEKAV